MSTDSKEHLFTSFPKIPATIATYLCDSRPPKCCRFSIRKVRKSRNLQLNKSRKYTPKPTETSECSSFHIGNLRKYTSIPTESSKCTSFQLGKSRKYASKLTETSKCGSFHPGKLRKYTSKTTETSSSRSQTLSTFLLLFFLFSSSLATPVSAQKDEKSGGYAFSYGVDDSSSGSQFSHSESRQGDVTTGNYSVHLPDGRIQIVSYTADAAGYRARITYRDDKEGSFSEKSNLHSSGEKSDAETIRFEQKIQNDHKAEHERQLSHNIQNLTNERKQQQVEGNSNLNASYESIENKTSLQSESQINLRELMSKELFTDSNVSDAAHDQDLVLYPSQSQYNSYRSHNNISVPSLINSFHNKSITDELYLHHDILESESVSNAPIFDIQKETNNTIEDDLKADVHSSIETTITKNKVAGKSLSDMILSTNKSFINKIPHDSITAKLPSKNDQDFKQIKISTSNKVLPVLQSMNTTNNVSNKSYDNNAIQEHKFPQLKTESPVEKQSQGGSQSSSHNSYSQLNNTNLKVSKELNFNYIDYSQSVVPTISNEFQDYSHIISSVSESVPLTIKSNKNLPIIPIAPKLKNNSRLNPENITNNSSVDSKIEENENLLNPILETISHLQHNNSIIPTSQISAPNMDAQDRLPYYPVVPLIPHINFSKYFLTDAHDKRYQFTDHSDGVPTVPYQPYGTFVNIPANYSDLYIDFINSNYRPDETPHSIFIPTVPPPPHRPRQRGHHLEVPTVPPPPSHPIHRGHHLVVPTVPPPPSHPHHRGHHLDDKNSLLSHSRPTGRWPPIDTSYENDESLFQNNENSSQIGHHNYGQRLSNTYIPSAEVDDDFFSPAHSRPSGRWPPLDASYESNESLFGNHRNSSEIKHHNSNAHPSFSNTYIPSQEVDDDFFFPERFVTFNISNSIDVKSSDESNAANNKISDSPTAHPMYMNFYIPSSTNNSIAKDLSIDTHFDTPSQNPSDDSFENSLPSERKYLPGIGNVTKTAYLKYRYPYLFDRDASVFHNAPSIIIDHKHPRAKNKEPPLTAPYVLVAGAYAPNPAAQFVINH